MDEETYDVQDLEIQSLIGFNGNPSNGLITHPDGVHLVYPLGTCVTAYNWDTQKQRFFQGHTNVISAMCLSRSGRYVAAGQVGGIRVVYVSSKHGFNETIRFSQRTVPLRFQFFAFETTTVTPSVRPVDGRPHAPTRSGRVDHDGLVD